MSAIKILRSSVGRTFAERAAQGLVPFACMMLVAEGADAAAPPQTPAEQVDAIVHRAMVDREIPGLQVAVVVDGRVVFSRSYGVANLQTPAPVVSTTVFTLNSITKAFTGVAVMKEVEKGRLDLSAPISKYLDDVPASWGHVQVRQLLGEISGLPDVYAFAGTDDTGLADERKAWDWTLTQPVSPPGEKENYCQTNLVLAQRIVDKLEGFPADSSIIGREIAVAGMDQTSFGDSRDVIKNKSQAYELLNTDHVIHNRFERFGPMMYSASGLNSTADDMARWMISIFDGKQLSEQSRRVLWTPVQKNDGTRSSYSIGWNLDYRRTYWSVGMVGGERSAFAVYPDYRTGVVILTNLLGSNPEDLTDEVASAFVPAIKLTGILKLRSEAERANFSNLSALIANAEARNAGHEINEEELRHWISELLDSGGLPRALQLAEFYTKVFPASNGGLEVLGKSYAANDRPRDARRVFDELRRRDPANVVALAYLKEQ